MMKIKTGDRLRLSTGVEATVVSFEGDSMGLDTIVKFPDYDYVSLGFLDHIGITWELVKPEIVEPLVGSMISFSCGIGICRAVHVAVRRSNGFWYSDGSSGSYDWEGLTDHYKFTEFELLRPLGEKE